MELKSKWGPILFKPLKREWERIFRQLDKKHKITARTRKKREEARLRAALRQGLRIIEEALSQSLVDKR